MPSRVLIVKFGAIGDVVMALPAVHRLHLEGAEIDWVCGRDVAVLLACYSWIHLIVVDDRAILTGSVVTQAAAILGLWRRIAGKPYDLCATLYYDARYRILALPVRSVRKLMLSRTNRELRLNASRAHADEYARILLGEADGCRAESLAPLRPDRLPPSPVPEKASRVRICLVPGGASNMLRQQTLRRWPVAEYIRLTGALLERGHELVLLGGPEDAWVRVEFEAAHGVAFRQGRVIDVIGSLTLPEVIAVCDSCDVVISHDTGPMHLAGLSRAALIGLFGPTDPGNFLPRRPGVRAIWGGEGFACRPCYDGASFAPCKENGCMQQITFEMVLRHVEDILAEPRRAQMQAGQVMLPSAALQGAEVKSELRRALFLDRDGVINQEIGYLSRKEDVVFVEGIFALCRAAKALGYLLVVVTNQAGIARGYYTELEFKDLMRWMRLEFEREGLELDAVYHCPFHPEHGIGEYRREHEDRKPGAGMLRRGAREFGLDLGRSVMVGDRCSDVAAANAAGVRQAFLVSGTETMPCSGDFLRVDSLQEVEQWLVERS